MWSQVTLTTTWKIESVADVNICKTCDARRPYSKNQPHLNSEMANDDADDYDLRHNKSENIYETTSVAAFRAERTEWIASKCSHN